MTEMKFLDAIAYRDKTFYETWQESEGVPVYRGYFIAIASNDRRVKGR